MLNRNFTLFFSPILGLLCLLGGFYMLSTFSLTDPFVIVTILLAILLDVYFIRLKLKFWKNPQIEAIKKGRENIGTYAGLSLVGMLIARYFSLSDNDFVIVISAAFVGLTMPFISGILFYEALTHKGIYTRI